MPGDGEDDDWILVGRIAGAFGVRGELKVEPLTDFPDRFSRLKSVFLGEAHAERAVLSTRAGKHILLRLENVDSRDAAQRLRGTDLWIPSSEAMELPPGEFFVDDIIGLTMVTDSGQTLGTVRDILTTGANDVYILAGSTGDILIPAIHDIVREIDVARGTIVIHPMDGLLD